MVETDAQSGNVTMVERYGWKVFKYGMDAGDTDLVYIQM